jgi:hypothetical protein
VETARMASAPALDARAPEGPAFPLESLYLYLSRSTRYTMLLPPCAAMLRARMQAVREGASTMSGGRRRRLSRQLNGAAVARLSTSPTPVQELSRLEGSRSPAPPAGRRLAGRPRDRARSAILLSSRGSVRAVSGARINIPHTIVYTNSRPACW